MTPNGTTTVCSLVSSLGSFQWITYKQFDREVQKFRNCLHRLSIGVDDKVSIIRYDSQIERERERGTISCYDAPLMKHCCILDQQQSRRMGSCQVRCEQFGGAVGTYVRGPG